MHWQLQAGQERCGSQENSAVYMRCFAAVVLPMLLLLLLLLLLQLLLTAANADRLAAQHLWPQSADKLHLQLNSPCSAVCQLTTLEQ
jgi:hypothetical protein